MKLSPVVFVVGPDLYQRDLCVDEIRTELFPNGSGGLNDDTFDARERPASEVVDLCNTLPMLAPRRLIVLRGVEKMPESDQECWCAYLENPSPQTVLVGLADKLDRRTRLAKALEKGGVIRPAEPPRLQELPAWVDRIARRHGVTVTPGARQALVDAVGTHLAALHQHLEKLALYVHPATAVDEKAVAELVLETSGETVFAWTDQVMEGRLPEAIATLDHLIEGGDAALGMVALLARHVRILMRAKELAAGRVSPRELPARLGVPPFAVQRYVEQARRFTEARLTDAIGELARLDHDLKSTGLSPHLLLERAVRNLGTPY